MKNSDRYYINTRNTNKLAVFDSRVHKVANLFKGQLYNASILRFRSGSERYSTFDKYEV